jgi:hypothetical protein
MTWRNGACATAMHKSIYKVFFPALYLYLSLSLSLNKVGAISRGIISRDPSDSFDHDPQTVE